ncbi:hypothetical protein KAM339_011590 [Aeromonas caviae]|uniref:hypothetical protein n=1 Tax=Aeromonas caviae TaxID=648 RepID=UPI001CC6D9CD|nr:hypothetical protein [Aeromonas caviae]BDA12618.1 hypothetical protein KAM339_011590 [Aeromonas caviae]
MKITFNGNTFTIPTNEQGQYHATALSQAWAAAGGQVRALDHWMRSLDEIQMRKFGAYSHAWRSLNNIHADHSITSMPIAQ